MAALTAAFARREWRGTFQQATLAMGNKCFQGGAIYLNPATGKAVSGANVAAAGLYFLGYATDYVDATLADALVNVNLIEETTLTYWDNGTAADAIAVTDLGKYAYALDDHTVTIVATGHSVAGIIKHVDAVRGIGVEKLRGNFSLAAPVLEFAAAPAASTSDHGASHERAPSRKG